MGDLFAEGFLIGALVGFVLGLWTSGVWTTPIAPRK